MRKIATGIIVAATALGLAACSEQTQEKAALTAERAAADTEENAEVVGNELREGAIVAADEISEGAADLRETLEADDAADTYEGDGQLDGTD